MTIYDTVVEEAKTFEILLKDARAKLGSTQEEISQAARVSPSYIRRLEIGSLIPTKAETILCLSVAYEIPYNELFVSAFVTRKRKEEQTLEEIKRWPGKPKGFKHER